MRAHPNSLLPTWSGQEVGLKFRCLADFVAMVLNVSRQSFPSARRKVRSIAHLIGYLTLTIHHSSWLNQAPYFAEYKNVITQDALATARKIAEDGAILLKNDGALPINPNKSYRLGLFGADAGPNILGATACAGSGTGACPIGNDNGTVSMGGGSGWAFPNVRTSIFSSSAVANHLITRTLSTRSQPSGSVPFPPLRRFRPSSTAMPPMSLH